MAVNKQFSYTIQKKDPSGARAGVIQTPHGAIQTPAFTPVATKAAVRTLTPTDVKQTGAQAVLANTYHLFLAPGTEVLDSFGGFAPFMGWDGPTITDSGGYQVSFIWDPKDVSGGSRASSVKITDEGATFRSHIDGSKHLLSPERSMEIQSSLNADIIMAFDQPLSENSTERRQKEAFARTLLWEERSLIHWERLQKERTHFQALYGIVQGETDEKLRRESLEFVLKLNFPGIAIGGASIGQDPQVTAAALDTIYELFPDDKPIHALGLGGGPEGIFEAVSRGVDTFDNTSITRMARVGILFIAPEDGGTIQNKFRVDVKRFSAVERGPISKNCSCYTCKTFDRGYIRHLIATQEMLGARLATIHNLTFINSLMITIREAILSGNFLDLKNSWLKSAARI